MDNFRKQLISLWCMLIETWKNSLCSSLLKKCLKKSRSKNPSENSQQKQAPSIFLWTRTLLGKGCLGVEHRTPLRSASKCARNSSGSNPGGRNAAMGTSPFGSPPPREQKQWVKLRLLSQSELQCDFFSFLLVCVFLAVVVLVDDDDDDDDDDTTTNKKTSLQTEVYGVRFCPLKVRHGGVQMEVCFKQALFSTKHFSRVRRQLEKQRKAKKQRNKEKHLQFYSLRTHDAGGTPTHPRLEFQLFARIVLEVFFFGTYIPEK